MKLPSGQAVARAMQVPVLPPSALSDVAAQGLDERTPLWFYVLREAHKKGSRQATGPGRWPDRRRGHQGLIEGDSQSYLTQDPGWTPDYGTGGDFRMVDLLTKAGVVGSL